MTKLEVSTHTGDIDVLQVKDYDPDDILQKLNDMEVQAIKIADNIYSRIDIKNIKPITDDESK